MDSMLVWWGIKYLLTIFVVILIRVYSRNYGYTNFLWLSDIGLFLTVIALWAHSPFIMSIAAVGVFIVEAIWCLDFFMNLFFNIQTIHLADYMFESRYSKGLRAISLFHIVTPIIWIMYLFMHQYDPRALYFFILLYWVIIWTTYFFTDPKKNINWVFLPKKYTSSKRLAFLWVVTLTVLYPLCIVLPTHLFFVNYF